MKSNLKVLLFTRKELKEELDINNIRKKFKLMNVIYDSEFNYKTKKLKKRYDFLISYRSKKILDDRILKKASCAAVNFHPGPPEFRGIGCANFALIKNVKFYGFTIHVMDRKVDHGKILLSKKFKIKKNTTITRLLKQTHSLMKKSFLKFIKDISLGKFSKYKLKNSSNIDWSKKMYNKKNLENIYKIKLPIKKKELEKIIRATSYKKFKPFIIVNGYKFVLTT
ncbi:formyltransferase family protein [Candidatus Pelagibacter sp.]|uniref:formyltransferase family protein n=1 Tax=Candidatus Pelagibacter sp. TaxID=2024849 RepID=UPI003F8641E5